MKRLHVLAVLLTMLLAASRISWAEGSPPLHGAPNPHPSAAYQWADIILETTAREVDRTIARPTIISRQMAIAFTAMYDAWAAYDARALGTRLGGRLRRPADERTPANREKAIAYAAHRTLVDLFPGDRRYIDDQMRVMGFNPQLRSHDTRTPEGVGNVAAETLLEYRRHDGSNQHGDAPGSNGKPYSDTSGYAPVNTPHTVTDPDRWQPIPFDDGKGGQIVLGFLTPHWGRVTPSVLERGDQFRPGPPPKVGSAQLRREVDECVAYNANLTLEQKSIVEFMRDGPRSTGQSGHWIRFAQDLSRRDGYDLDRDVKLFFCIANTAFDAFIACWDAKRVYDSSRPWTLVRYYYKGKTVVGWIGPGKGHFELPADKWHPYSPFTFVTPPFPGYPSGHSTVSGACARMLALFSGSDRFGFVARRNCCALTEVGYSPQAIEARAGGPKPGLLDTLDTELHLPTFTATAEMAGISRVMGGYHIQTDNVAGLTLGRQVADYAWPRFETWFDGTASTR